MNQRLNRLKATVTAVDEVRSVCKCLTHRGQSVYDVRWVSTNAGPGWSSDVYTPRERDVVYIERDQVSNEWSITGYELIPYRKVLDTPLIGTHRDDPLLKEELMDLTTMKFYTMKFGPSRPDDFKVGDRIFTSELGGMFGLRRNGTFLAKANTLCQFLLSPYGDVSRLVARNQEYFSDARSDYMVNSRGITYQYSNVFSSQQESRKNEFSIETLLGDVQQADMLKDQYGSLTKDKHQDAVSKKVAEDAGAVARTRIFDTERTMTHMETLFRSGLKKGIIRNKDDSKTNLYERSLELCKDELHDTQANTHYTDNVSAASRRTIFDDQSSSQKLEEVSSGAKKSIQLFGDDGCLLELTGSSARTNVAGARVDLTKDTIKIDLDGSSVITVSKGMISIKAQALNVDAPTASFTGMVNIAKTLTVVGMSQFTGGANFG